MYRQSTQNNYQDSIRHIYSQAAESNTETQTHTSIPYTNYFSHKGTHTIDTHT